MSFQTRDSKIIIPVQMFLDSEKEFLSPAVS